MIKGSDFFCALKFLDMTRFFIIPTYY